MKDQNQDEGFAGGEGDISGYTLDLHRIRHSNRASTYKDLIKVLNQIEEVGYDIKEIYNSPFKKHKRFRGHKFANNQLRYFYVYKIINIENNHQFYLCEIDTSDGKKISPPYYSHMKKELND
jgi:hypothetical protein